MKKGIVSATWAVLTVVALGACSEATAPNAMELEPAFSKGVSAPGTAVGSTFTVSLPDQTVITYRTTPKNNKGRCEAGGVWFNQSGNNQNANHTQCTDITTIPGETVTVTFNLTANYVLATSGNIQLNFAPTCVLDVCTPNSIQYKKGSIWTEGTGAVVGADDKGGEWTINLAQIGLAGTAGMESTVKSVGPLVATRTMDGLMGAATISWQ